MTNKMNNSTLFWFRRDLRLYDNHGLYRSLEQSGEVIPIFIFDKNILDELPKEDARVTFIHDTIAELKEQLQGHGSDLRVYYGDPIQLYEEILQEHEPKALYFNHDYEPYAVKRDEKVRELCSDRDIEVHSFKDHVIFEKNEVVKSDGDPYVVFTPYKKIWLKAYEDYRDTHYASENHLDKLKKIDAQEMISLEDMGFSRSDIEIPSQEVKRSVIKNYDETRNYPANEEGTSRLGIHYRFGTISIREKARKAVELNDTYLSELIWRDFYSQILHHFPKVVDTAFREKYDEIQWRNNKEEFEAWCEGRTGYPIVDAGMRELNETGYMHNRIRMVTASFLTKHLLIDWRWGEAYFAEKLLDYDLASNNGGWQWAAGSGTDAAPYFRIFNPTSQMQKFDKEKTYIKRYVPEYGTDDYPDPIVDHKEARERCLDRYKSALN